MRVREQWEEVPEASRTRGRAGERRGCDVDVVSSVGRGGEWKTFGVGDPRIVPSPHSAMLTTRDPSNAQRGDEPLVRVCVSVRVK